jgi:aspartate-semialdehyde dehydrogenase
MSQDRKYRVGILGATGLVGQRFVSLLHQHPWFEVVAVAASPQSAGKTYAQAVSGRWVIGAQVPQAVAPLVMLDASAVEQVARQVDFVFCAVDMPKAQTRELEERYARSEVPVVSNNSAHRSTPDVPMMVPECNPEHAAMIVEQRKRLGTRKGFIAVKPNCSLQSYLPALHPLRERGLLRVSVCTYQALSGAGKTPATWPEMADNVIPFISGEEDKSEQEPLKIWGTLQGSAIQPATSPRISAQCIRVPVTDGHLAAVSVAFQDKPSREWILEQWKTFQGRPQQLRLPSAPAPFLRYFEEDARPQTRLDRDAGGGMAITLGRLRDDPVFDYKFVALSHNTVRGAAGGAILTAELLVAEGYLPRSV